MQIESGTDTSSGGSILLEAGTIDQSSSSTTLTTVTGDNNFYIIQDTAATDADRPQEGDVVYHPILDKLFEINFVDHDEPFYQLDNNAVYKLRCRLYEYSSDILDTGISDIDGIETSLSISTAEFQFTLEQATDSLDGNSLTVDNNYFTTDVTNVTLDSTVVAGTADPASFGSSILLENSADTGQDAYLISEDMPAVGDYVDDKTSQNELFDTLDDTVLDFSETNPFGDAGSL